MKKNIILYVLLIFLIVVNGFFLLNYLKGGTDNKKIEPQRNRDFIVNELNFDEMQLEQFNAKSEDHHETMKLLSDEIKELKDDLFETLFNNKVNETTIDSLSSLICEKEKEKEKEIFYHFRAIQEIANDKQKEKFKLILKDALRRGEQGNRPPPPNDRNGHRPLPKHN